MSHVTASAQVAVVDKLPVDGVDFLLSNDLAGTRVFSSSVPIVEAPAGREDVDALVVSLHLVCASTCSLARS